MKIIHRTSGMIMEFQTPKVDVVISERLDKYASGNTYSMPITYVDNSILDVVVNSFLNIHPDWIREEEYLEEWPKLPFGDELEHDFLYRIYVSDADIKMLNKLYFNLVLGIKAAPENPSVTVNGGEVIYVDNIDSSAYYVFNNILHREFEANPRLLTNN